MSRMGSPYEVQIIPKPLKKKIIIINGREEACRKKHTEQRILVR